MKWRVSEKKEKDEEENTERMLEWKEREDRLNRRLKWSKSGGGRTVDDSRLTVKISPRVKKRVNKSVFCQIVLISVFQNNPYDTINVLPSPRFMVWLKL